MLRCVQHYIKVCIMCKQNCHGERPRPPFPALSLENSPRAPYRPTVRQRGGGRERRHKPTQEQPDPQRSQARRKGRSVCLLREKFNFQHRRICLLRKVEFSCNPRKPGRRRRLLGARGQATIRPRWSRPLDWEQEGLRIFEDSAPAAPLPHTPSDSHPVTHTL